MGVKRTSYETHLTLCFSLVLVVLIVCAYELKRERYVRNLNYGSDNHNLAVSHMLFPTKKHF